MKYNRFIFIIFLFVFNICNTDDYPKTESITLKMDEEKKFLVFLGDSLTAGMGLDGIDDSYANLVHKKLLEDGLNYTLINGGVSGDTTSGGLTRLDWVISRGVDIFVLELGANDMMRGTKPELVYRNLEQIILKVKEKNKNVKILIIPMKPFPNMGAKYGKVFEKIYFDLSKNYNLKLSTFLLENVAGIPELNQRDGIHPTRKGHKIMAENIYPALKELITLNQ